MAGGHAWQGACIVVGACLVGGLHGRVMHGRRPCVAGGVHGGGHAWSGACMAGGVHDGWCAWQGVCMAGACMAGACMAGVHTWQERWPLQWTVYILLEFILVYLCFSRRSEPQALTFHYYKTFFEIIIEGKLMRQGGLNHTEEQVKMAIKQVNKDGRFLNIIVKIE